MQVAADQILSQREGLRSGVVHSRCHDRRPDGRALQLLVCQEAALPRQYFVLARLIRWANDNRFEEAYFLDACSQLVNLLADITDPDLASADNDVV